MKIDFSRLDALRPTAAVPEGFEPVPEAETPFDSGYEAMYRAAWDFHLETDDPLLAPKGRVAPSGKTISASSRPASGPSTPICDCPAWLVAAIFQPHSGFALVASSLAWMA